MKPSFTCMAVWAALASVAPLAHGTDLLPTGGDGGQYYKRVCGSGSHLVGFTAQLGRWVDRLQIVCAGVSGGTVSTPQPMLPAIGDSNGGIVNNAYCPGGAIVARLWPQFTIKNEGGQPQKGFLDDMQLGCADLASGTFGPGDGYNPWLRSGGGGPRAAGQPQTCPQGELGVGVHGGAGLFVDSIGLICAPAPAAAPVAEAPIPPSLPDVSAARRAAAIRGAGMQTHTTMTNGVPSGQQPPANASPGQPQAEPAGDGSAPLPGLPRRQRPGSRLDEVRD